MPDPTGSSDEVYNGVTDYLRITESEAIALYTFQAAFLHRRSVRRRISHEERDDLERWTPYLS